MKSIDVYLMFDGNCREAMTFYADALGANVDIMSGDQAPGVPESDKDRVLHARIEIDGTRLMGSDTMSMTPFKLQQGNNFSVSLDCNTPDEQDLYFNNLKEGGEVTMPLQDTFWGAYFGMLTDPFGIQWMFSCDLKKG